MKYIILLLLFAPTLLFAQKVDVVRYGVDTAYALPKGLNVGDKAPVFSVMDVNGKSISSEELSASAPIVILFYRGQWCPVCSKYLRNLNDSIQLIVDRGATVIAVTPETEKNALKMKKSTKSDFSFVSDTSMSIHHSFDVAFHVTRKYQVKIKSFLMTDIATNNGKDEAVLPVPATYIIGTNGMIVYRQFNYNYKNRASVKSILDHL